MNLEKIGPLQALVKPCENPEMIAVMCHGYGADANDLAPLAEVLQGSRRIHWVFPQAPLELDMSFGFGGRAWFPLDVEAYEKAMRTGTFRDMASSRPDGLDAAQNKFTQMIENLPLENSKIVVGGFSQGAMVTTDFALQTSQKPRGLMVLSGSLLNRKLWSEQVQSCEGLPYFQSHGHKDPVLSFDAAAELNKMFEEAGMKGGFHEFPGGHEIPPDVLMNLVQFIKHI